MPLGLQTPKREVLPNQKIVWGKESTPPPTPRLLPHTHPANQFVDPVATQLISPPESKSSRDGVLPPTPYDWSLLGTGTQSEHAENRDPAADTSAKDEYQFLRKDPAEFIMWAAFLRTPLNMQIPPALVYP